MGLFNKKELERIKELEKMVKELNNNNNKLTSELKKYKKENEKKQQEIENLINRIDELEILDINYHYEDSQDFEYELEKIRNLQNTMINEHNVPMHSFISSDSDKLKSAVIYRWTTWMWRTKDVNMHYLRWGVGELLIRAFNSECDSIISNVKFNNIKKSHNKIKKIFKTMNELTNNIGTELTENYLELKLKELELRCGYVTMKQKEKEEQQRIKEQMREEERVRKELEVEEKKVEKEEKHFMNELNKLQKRIKKESEETQKILLKQIEELQSKLSELSEVKADIMNRRLNNKAGYVYIISNVGSFGENVYKIGTTRRLEPQVRVDELSNASVPFKFDVHAMIFSDDAFDLENKLHQMFDNKRINKVNKHKEFFGVTLEEIEKAVKENFNETVIFNKTVINEEYLLSLGK